MPSKSTTTFQTFVEGGSFTRYKSYRRCNSTWAIKNGRPDLSVQNPHSYINNTLENYYVNDPTAPNGHIWEVYPGGVSDLLQPFGDRGINWTQMEQIALAKFTGKLRKGSASLGVTAGSWGQSSSMIRTRLDQASRALSNVHAKLLKDPKRLRKIRKDGPDPIANLVLEGEFGWRPLIQDIRSSLGVIAGDTIPPCWITGRHRAVISDSYWSPKVADNYFGRETRERWDGSAMVTVAATCSVSNPNLFLLNHLGLLNPFVVAWDLIPWSFVVGMFVNVQAMLNSLTNEVGLSVLNKSTTRSCKTTYDQHLRYVVRTKVTATGGLTIKSKWRDRTVGSHPAIKLQVRVPELNSEQLVIAASLVVQRFKAINKLIAG